MLPGSWVSHSSADFSIADSLLLPQLSKRRAGSTKDECGPTIARRVGFATLRNRRSPMTSGPFDLTGKVAIVTGGNGGIGLGMARGLADAGADIAVVGRNEAKAADPVEDLRKRGVKAMAVATDVTDKAAVSAMIERVGKAFGRIDILVNNAGTSIR